MRDVAAAVWRWVVAMYLREPAVYKSIVAALIAYYVFPRIPEAWQGEFASVVAAVLGLSIRQSVFSLRTVEKVAAQAAETGDASEAVEAHR